MGFCKQENQDNEGGKMKEAISMFAALAIIAGLCVGCGKADKSEPEAAKKPKAHSADDGQDHSGHNH